MDRREEFVRRMRRSMSWSNAITEFAKETSSDDSGGSTSEAYFALGQLAERVIPDRKQAIGYYQQSIAQNPGHLESVARLSGILAALGNLSELASVGSAAIANGTNAIPLIVITAEALFDTGRRDEARAMIEPLMAGDDIPAEVQELAAVLEVKKGAKKEVKKLVSQAGKAEPHDAANLLVRAARIARDIMSDDDKYQELLAQAVEHAPHHRVATTLLDNQLARLKQWNELLSWHMGRIEKTASASARAVLCQDLALKWVSSYGDPAAGAALFQQAFANLAQAGADTHLVSFIAGVDVLAGRALEQEEHLLDAIGALEPVAQRGDDNDKLFVALKLAELWRKAGDETAAAKYLEQAAAIEPDAPLVIDFKAQDDSMPASTDDASDATQDTNDKSDMTVKEQEISGEQQETPPAEAEAIELDDAQGAEQSAESAEPTQEANPDDADASKETKSKKNSKKKKKTKKAAAPVVSEFSLEDEQLPDDVKKAVDEALAEDGDAAEAAIRKVIEEHPEYAGPRAAYAGLLRQSEKWTRLLDAYKDELKHVVSDAHHVAVLQQMSDLYIDNLNNPAQGIRTLEKVLTVDANRLDVYDRLAAFYEEKKRWPDMIKALSNKAEVVPSDEDRVALYLQIANLYVDRFSNQAEAIKAYEKVLEHAPDNQEAMENLLAVYEKRRDWSKYLAIRERQLENLSGEERAQQIIEIAELVESKVKKPDMCTVWWERVLEVDQSHQQAVEALVKLYERQKNWEGLAKVSETLIAIAPDEKTQVDALQKLGVLYTDRVEKPEQAITAWKRLLDIDPEHRRAQDSVKKLFIAEGDWQGLEDFYRDRDKLEEFVRVLERQVDQEESIEEKRKIGLKVAALYRDEIDKSDRAIRAYEKVLSFDDECLEAAEALIPLYEGGRDPRKLVTALEIQLKATEDDELKVERLKRLAEYSEESLRDKSAAFGYWMKAHSLKPNEAWIREHLERLAEETKLWSELVETYNSSMSKADDENRLQMMKVVARVLETELGDVDKALAINNQIWEIDNSDPAVIEALERLFIGKESYDELLSVYQRKLEITDEPEAQIEIYNRMGTLYDTQMEQPKKAIESYKAILDIDPTSTVALGALSRLHEAGGNWKQKAEILDQQILLLEPSDEQFLELSHQLASLKAEHLDDLDGAIAGYQEVLTVNARFDKSRQALEKLLDNQDKQKKVADVLEPIYMEIEDWPNLARVYETQIAHKKEPFDKLTLLLQLGELHTGRLADPEGAFKAYCRAMKVDPASEQAKSSVEEIAALLDDGWKRVAQLYVEILKREDLDPLLAHELSKKVATTYHLQLGDTETAVTYYTKSLEQDPDDLDTINALEQIFDAENNHKELLVVLKKKADLVPDAEQRQRLLFRAAGIYEHELKDVDNAIETYNEALAIEPDNIQALRALDELLTSEGRYRELSENLQKQLTLVDNAQDQVTLLLRLGELREKHLDERTLSVETYQEVLQVQPGNEQAVAALERLGQVEELELTVAQILEPTYQATGDLAKQIGVYEVMAKHAYDPEKQIQLLHKIAELQELLDDQNAAFQTFSRALKVEAANEQTINHLDRLARMSGQWLPLVELYEAIAKDDGDEEVKAKTLTRVAQIYEVELQNDQKAVETYQKVLALPNPNGAVQHIESIHRRNENYPELVSVLLMKAESTIDPSEQKPIYYEAAYLQEHTLQQPEKAVKTYESILDVDDTEMQALDSLVNLHIQRQEWDSLKDVYSRKAELLEDPDQRKQVLYVLGQVYDTELQDTAKAIETYQAILDIDPNDVPAIQSLDRLFSRAERWYDQLQNLEQQLNLAEMPAEIVGIKYRIGKLWEDHLEDKTRAVESYREALSMDPAHPQTIAALEGLATSGDEALVAAEVLEPIYEASGEWEKLARVLEVKVGATEDPESKVALLHRLAEVYEHRVGDLQAAFGAFSRALQVDATHELTLGHLERLAEVNGNWPAYAELLAAESEKTMEVPIQVNLLSRLAIVQEGNLTDIDGAIATYQKIQEVDFENMNALMSLDRLYTQTEKWAELAEVLKKAAQLTEDDQTRITLMYRHAQTLEKELEDAKSAVQVYQELLELDPAHEHTIFALESLFVAGTCQSEIAQVLEPLYEDTAEYGKLHALYETQLPNVSDKTERVGMYQRLAEISERQLGDLDKAQHWWSEGMCEDPTWIEAIESSERIAEATQRWDLLVQANAKVVDRHQEREHKRGALLRMARYYETQLGNSEQAVQTLLQVLELDDKDADALASLDRLYEAQSNFGGLVDILRRRAEVTLDGDEIAQLQLRRGSIYANVLGDPDQALACFEQVLEQDSTNRTALESSEAIHFTRQDWQKLFNTYERMLDVADGDEELAGVYSRMARIAADALEDDERAIDLWVRVSDILGENIDALQALGEIHERREQYQELVEVVERQLAIAYEPQLKAVLFKRLGYLWDQKLENRGEAIAAWRAAEEQSPHDLEALQQLSRLYEETQSWEDLSDALNRLVEAGQVTGGLDEDQLISLYTRIGKLESDVLGRTDHSVEAWRKVLTLNPSDFTALEALEQLFSRDGRWEEAIEVLERRALLVENEDERIENLLQAAANWQEKLHNLDEAASVYERVRAADPSNEVASQQLEVIYREQYKWEPLTAVLLERVEHSEENEERIAIFNAVAKIYEEELGSPENAFVVLQYAFQEDFAHEQTGKELERLASATNQWEDLLTQYTQKVKQLESADSHAAADLWVKIGRWYGEHLSHVDWGIHSVQQALRLHSDHLGAFSALADLQRQRGAWSELTETLRQHAEVEPNQERKCELLLSLANLLENQIQDPQSAIQTYQRALDVESTSIEALSALERLYRGFEQWDQLINVLERRSDTIEDNEEVVRLKLEIGEIWDIRMFESGESIRVYQQVVDLDPACLQALKALEQLYEKTGQSEKYLEALEAQLDLSATDIEQVALYERMASAWEERFGKLDRAAECLEKIVAIDSRNYQGFRELARIYRQDGRWESLVDTYRNHILSASDSATKIELYCDMADVYENQMQDVDRAIEAYNDVLTFDANEPRALDGLGRLYEKISEWERSIDVMMTLEKQTDSPFQRVDLLHRIGRICFRHTNDVARGEDFLHRGLSLDPTHMPTMEVLVELYSGQGDWIKAANMMVRAEESAQTPLEKIKLLNGAASIFLNQLGDRDNAKQYYSAVIALDPENKEALEPLADLYFEDQQWEELGPVIGTLVRKTQQERIEEDRLQTLYYRAARCSEELGDFDRASTYYKAAYDIDPTHLPTLVGRGDLLFKMKDWDNAAKIYQTVLVQQRDSTNTQAIVEVYFKLGQVRLALGEKRKAQNMFEKALEIDPHNRPTLEAMIDLQANNQNWEGVIQAKRALMAKAEEPEVLEILESIGDIQNQHLNNPQKSIVAYADALNIKPDSHQVIQKLLDRYTETEQWQKAVDTIQRFIDLESDSFRRGMYRLAAGNVCRGQLKAMDQAIEHYEAALDDFFSKEDIDDKLLPKALKPFEYVDKILTKQRDWKAQERAYRRMIKRIPPGSKILIELWHALGEIYRSRLKHYQSAIQAFEIAQGLQPDNADRGAILAELYVMAGPDYADKAVQLHWDMLQREPFKYDSYRALRQLYMDTHQYDKTWCVCATLAFLKKANAEEMQFYEQYKPRGFVKANKRMNDEMWKLVYHPDENRYISSIFGAIWQGPASLRARPHKDFGLRRRDARPADDQLMFTRILRYAAQVMNVPMPELYVQEQEPGGILIANTAEKNQLIPSFVVRQGVLQGKPEKELAFLCGRNLDYMRPEHYLRRVLPSNTERKVALMSALVLVRNDFPVPPDLHAHVQEYLPEMQKRIPPNILEQLGVIVGRFLQSAPQIDLATWGNAVDGTGHRIGFVLCGDMEVAARAISAEPTEVGAPQAKDKIRDLVLFSISESYFKIREHLGTTIG